MSYMLCLCLRRLRPDPVSCHLVCPVHGRVHSYHEVYRALTGSRS